MGLRYGAKGTNALGKLDDGKRVRAVLIEEQLRHGETPRLDDLREALASRHRACAQDHARHHGAESGR